jgi:hypothetical protein
VLQNKFKTFRKDGTSGKSNNHQGYTKQWLRDTLSNNVSDECLRAQSTLLMAIGTQNHGISAGTKSYPGKVKNTSSTNPIDENEHNGKYTMAKKPCGKRKSCSGNLKLQFEFRAGSLWPAR